MDAIVSTSAGVDLRLLGKTVAHHGPLRIFKEPAAVGALHHSLKRVHAAPPQCVSSIERLIKAAAPAVALDTFESAENEFYAAEQHQHPAKDQERAAKKKEEETE